MPKTRDGRPCRNCGTTRKWVSTSSCVKCVAERTKRIRRTDGREVTRREQARIRKQRQYARDPDRILNLSKYRKQAIKQATPGWLSKEDRDTIDAIYLEARKKSKEEGIQYSVDHIVPLKGKTVCGLHVPSNLQIMLLSDNARKNNHYA